MRASFLYILLSLLFIGCSSTSPTSLSDQEPAPNPISGSWKLDNSDSVIHFLSTGRITIEPGELRATINRFQNTDRNRYTSNLLSTGQYEVLNDEELVLYVTADWTGKGTGARRPSDKRVESTILFEFEIQDNSTLFLYQKNLAQGGSNEYESSDELQLTLHFIE